MAEVSRWELDGDAQDAVGANDGSLVGAPAFGDSLVTSEGGGQAIVFDGTSKRVEVPNHASLQFTSAYTLSAWIERGDTASGYILVKGTDDYYLWMGAGDGLEVGHRSADGTYRTLTVATPIRLGHKVRVDGVFDGANLRLYLNGRQIASVAQTNAARTTTGVLQIGSNGSDHWNGRVDKVRVHDTAQSPAEILAEYRAESLIIFEDGFESGGTGLWIEEQEVGPTASVSVTTNDPVPAEGSFALRSFLDDGDERAELRMSSNLHRFTEGDDIYIRLRVFLTAPFPVDSSAWGTILAQLHNAVSGGGPVVSLGVSGDPGLWSVDGDTNAATAGGEVIDWAGPAIETGRWIEIVIRVLHSADPGTGLVEVWHDGVKVASSQRLTLVNDHNYLKVGYYRDNTITGAGIVGTDGLVIARQHLWLPPPAIHVREKPPLWLAHDITAPSGRHYRWAEDEPEAANVPSGETLSTTAPGGFEQAGARLPRKPGIDYGDARRLADWRIYGAGGEVAYEGRLNRAAKSSGDDQAISPEAAGWQAHLEDDKTASFIGIDRDLGRWQGSSAQRRVNLKGAGNVYNPTNDGQSIADTSTGMPVLRFEISGHMPGVTGALAESWYDAGPGNLIAGLIAGASEGQNHSSASFKLAANGADSDTNSGGTADAFAVTGATSLATAYRALAAAKRWLTIQWLWSGGAFTGDENERWRDVKQIAVVGDHDLPLYGLTGEEGLLASDIVAYALAQWAPLLNFTAGAKGTIQPTGFPIPHLAFHEPTTTAEIVKEALRYHVNPWFVWEDRTFYMHQWGARGRKWRARVGPSKLQQAGDDVERLWNGVVVQFRDVDGSTRTVGPPGSGADTEDASLFDDDPENPINQIGIPLRCPPPLDMGTVSRPLAAIEVGRRFLEESKLLDTSGTASHVGTAIDEHGVEWPAWMIRAGDSIAYIDAAEPGYRRVVRTQYDHSTRTCTVDLDAPPQSMDALLSRLGVAVVGIGFG